MYIKAKAKAIISVIMSFSSVKETAQCKESEDYIELPLRVYEDVRRRFHIMPWTLFEWLDSKECGNVDAVKAYLITREAQIRNTGKMSDDQLLQLLHDIGYMRFMIGSNLFGKWIGWDREWLRSGWGIHDTTMTYPGRPEDAEVDEWSKMGWNRRRHTSFGSLVNKVFTVFLLGYIRVVCTDNSGVPDADPEMVEEMLESLHRF